MNTISVSEAKDQLSNLIQAANDRKQQVRITSEDGSVILLPEETYENILVTLELLSTPGLMDTLKGFQGQACEQEEAIEYIS